MRQEAWCLVLLMAGFANGAIVKEKPEFSAEGRQIMNMVYKTCLRRSGANAEILQKCEDGEFLDDPKLKVHTLCVFQECAIADEKGEVDFDLMVMLMPERYRERMRNMYFPCRDLDLSKYDAYNKVYEVCKCAFKNDPAFFFLVQ